MNQIPVKLHKTVIPNGLHVVVERGFLFTFAVVPSNFQPHYAPSSFSSLSEVTY